MFGSCFVCTFLLAPIFVGVLCLVLVLSVLVPILVEVLCFVHVSWCSS